tara:strand:+ start:2398 stop:3999 length:1602 start_codon:yes stop_codon:yes gene_type:complete
MATYPDDATAPITAFSVVADTTFSSTGAIRTEFNLPSVVTHKGEITAFIDGVLQQTTAYDLSNSGQTASFLVAPNASNLTIKTISLPSRFRLTRSFPAVRSVDYSNTSATVVDSNSYLINANTEFFALPSGVNVSSSTDFMVFLSGVFQNSDAYTYPSTTLGNHGIDIGDNAAVKLLTNFSGNLTDESSSAHTLNFRDGSASFASSKQLDLDGTAGNFADIADNDDFNILSRDFTLDTFIKPDTGTTMTSNQTLFAKHAKTNNNNYTLRLVGANSNVGFIVNDGGNITELYGGNANGGVNLHVAVSHEKNTNNLRLYVNNVKVAHKNFTADDFAGNVIIGSNSNTASEGERFSGLIEYTRLSHSIRYRSGGISPIKNHTPTIISGAPLGAISSEDTLSIRVFDSEVTTLDRFNSMADRKPDKGFTAERSFDSVTFTSQAGYEKRRLRSRRSKRNYSLQYTNITGVEKTAIENFYNARSGQFEAFTFDLSHLNESGTITTRFEGPLSVTQVISSGSSLTENFYTVTFKLQETYD